MTQDIGTPVTPIPDMPPAQPVQPKKDNRTLWIIIAVVVVLLCCCCLVVAGIVAYQNSGMFSNLLNGVTPPGY